MDSCTGLGHCLRVSGTVGVTTTCVVAACCNRGMNGRVLGGRRSAIDSCSVLGHCMGVSISIGVTTTCVAACYNRGMNWESAIDSCIVFGHCLRVSSTIGVTTTCDKGMDCTVGICNIQRDLAWAQP